MTLNFTEIESKQISRPFELKLPFYGKRGRFTIVAITEYEDMMKVVECGMGAGLVHLKRYYLEDGTPIRNIEDLLNKYTEIIDETEFDYIKNLLIGKL